MRLSRENGLSELISRSIDLNDAIKSIPLAAIDFIPTGKVPPNPSELLLHERFGQLLETVSNQYDLVIIDSPPILAATDAAIIGRLASVTLMAVRAGTHPYGNQTECKETCTGGRESERSDIQWHP